MKKQLLYLFFASISAISCEKTADIVLPTDENIYDIRFKVSSFSVEEEAIGKISSVAQKNSKSSAQPFNAVQDYLNLLDYFIYDESGKLVAQLSQDKSFFSPSPISYYGEAAFALPKGNYKMAVVGAVSEITFGDSTQFSTAYLAPSYVVEDIFFKLIDFNVTGDQDIEESIKLERIVGSIEIEEKESVTDRWGGRPQVTFKTVTRYPFDKNQKATTDYLLLPFVSGELTLWKTTTFISKGFMLPDRSGNFNPHINIMIPGERMNQIANKSFDNIIIRPNRKVTLQGSLTGLYQNQHTTITADSSWSDHDIIDFKQ